MAIRVPSVASHIRIPLEITDMITDFLFDDVQALSTMSLVCKAFLPSTRLHLFEDMTIRLDHPYRAEFDPSQLEELMATYHSLRLSAILISALLMTIQFASLLTNGYTRPSLCLSSSGASNHYPSKFPGSTFNPKLGRECSLALTPYWRYR
jgi:hypothetical protein